MTAAAAPALATLDLALRAGLVVLMLFLGALVWRDHRQSRAGLLTAALALGIAAYALQSSPAFWSWPPAVRAPLAVLSTGNVVVFWLFARTVFDDDFRLRPWHGLAWAAFALMALLYRLAPQLDLAITVGTLAVALLAMAQTIASWQADLVEGRRRLRVFIVAAGGLYTAVNMATRLWHGPLAELWHGPLELVVLSAIALAAAWRLVGVSGVVFAPPAQTAPPLRQAQPAAEVLPPDPAEQALLAALSRVMDEEHAYREEGLSIAALAQRLAVPEYRLRRAINQRLGHRNFNAFLNHYRLAEVRQALADPARAQVPVLTLALDAGFQSIGPFNRAFKAATGLTPTEFRRQNLADS